VKGALFAGERRVSTFHYSGGRAVDWRGRWKQRQRKVPPTSREWLAETGGRTGEKKKMLGTSTFQNTSYPLIDSYEKDVLEPERVVRGSAGGEIKGGGEERGGLNVLRVDHPYSYGEGGAHRRNNAVPSKWRQAGDSVLKEKEARGRGPKCE